MDDVVPLAGLAPWIGGKRLLAATIVPRIEAVPHRTYCEPFVGMGGIFFRRRRMPPAEVINDLSRDVATLFRVLQRHFLPFVDLLRWQVSARAEFERLMASDPVTLTDLERSARFLYLQRTTFGAKVRSRTFGVDPRSGSAFDPTRIIPELQAFHDRLARVTIECLPYDALITRYDRPETLFYLDPPYWGCEADYGRELFRREDFERLALQLAGLRGRFILSLNDHPEVRRVFSAFAMEEVRTRYSVRGKGPHKQVGELLISGP